MGFCMALWLTLPFARKHGRPTSFLGQVFLEQGFAFLKA
jgi:hypothetical protein